MRLFPKDPQSKLVQVAVVPIGLALLVLAVGIGGWLFSSISRTAHDMQQLQKNPTEEAKRKFDASLESTKAIVAGIGTIATIAGGIFLYVNYKQAQDRLDHEKKKAQKDVEIAESRLITERFSKAVEQLGSEKMEVRIGAIYSLERIAKDSHDDHWTVMEVLTAFIRERSPIRPKKERTSFASSFLENQSSKSQLLLTITTDVQAALTVIGRRNISREKPEQRLNLSYCNLNGANFEQGRFQRTIFVKSNFEAANLQDAELQEADFTWANLRYSYLDKAKLHRAKLSADFYRASLYKAELQGANLLGACLEGGVDLRESNFQEANLYGAQLQGASFEEAQLKFANFEKSNLQNAAFKNTKLEKANFEYADLQGTHFQNVDLTDALFCGAKLQGADFFESYSLQGTDFTSANLKDTAFDSLEQFKEAKFCRTTMPDGTENNRDC